MPEEGFAPHRLNCIPNALRTGDQLRIHGAICLACPASALRESVLAFFPVAVVASTWFGGSGPGWVAVGLSTLAVHAELREIRARFD
jgi:hypothetical protein